MGLNVYKEIIEEAHRKYPNVPVKMIEAIIQIESSGKANAMSSKGAVGLMQLMPSTAKDLGVVNPLDPKQNILGGTKYLSQLLKRYEGDVDKTVAAYNWGLGRVDKKGIGNLPTETKNYLSKYHRLVD